MLSTMDVKQIRRTRLIWLRDARFKGVAADLARAIGKSPAQVNQWISGHRNMDEGSAAAIEAKLRLPIGTASADPPAADIKQAVDFMIRRWQANDEEHHTMAMLTEQCVSLLGEFETGRTVSLRIQNGPFDTELVGCLEDVTGLIVEFPASVISKSSIELPFAAPTVAARAQRETSDPLTLVQRLQTLLAPHSATRRRLVGGLLAQLAESPGDQELAEELAQQLEPPAATRQTKHAA